MYLIYVNYGILLRCQAMANAIGRSAKVPEGESLCVSIRRAEQALMAHHEAALRKYGLTMIQYAILLTLSRQGGMSGAKLAKACGVTQQSMASVLAVLQNKELISREASADHAKVLIATLTKRGSGVLDKAYGEVKVLESALASVFSPKEAHSLCALLARATDELVRQTATAAATHAP
jgi:DNA-binding MarR family transcriptional regulator